MSRRHHTVRIASCILLGALMVAATPAPVTLARSGTTCLVRNVTQGTRSGSFRVVVVLAHDGDRLQVRGTCHTRGIAIDKDLVIRGMGARATLDGQARYRVLRIKKGAVVTLRHLVLMHGRPARFEVDFFVQGGGISNRGTLTLIDSVVTENDGAYTGGGIFNLGTLTLVRSRVSDHGTGYPDDEAAEIQGVGGGIFNTGIATLRDSVVSHNATDYAGAGIFNTGTMTLMRSRVSDNGSNHGAAGGMGSGSGGIVNTGRLVLVDSAVTRNGGGWGGGIGNTGTVRLTGSTVAGNSAYGRGGGIFNGGRGRVIIEGGSRVTGNHVGSQGGGGGGIFNGRGGTVTIKGGSTVADNSSGSVDYPLAGGGIHNQGKLTLRDSTVTSNTASGQGGGIFSGASGTVTLRGSASVTGNTPDDCVGTPAC